MKISVAAVALSASLLGGCAFNAGGASPPSSAIAPAGSMQSSQYTVTSLSPIGGSTAGANSINNRDWVSGTSTLASSSFINAALWEQGGSPINLGTLGGPNSGVEWPVKNDHGLISGISETAEAQKLGEIWSCALGFFPQPPSGHICRGFGWQNGKMVGLKTLGGNNGFAAGANERGDIVGWAETRKHDATCTPPQVLQFEAVVYWGGRTKPEALRPYRGDKDGAATETNDRGQIVGISGKCDQAEGRFTAKHAVMWQDGKVINLGTLGGNAWNTPMAINDSGEVVGFSNTSSNPSGAANFHAFLWTQKSGMTDLGVLPGDAYSEALGINESGTIVGVSYGVSFSTSRAFIWQNGKMTDLNTLIPPSSSLYLLYANDINDQGVIAGGACVLVSGSCGTQLPAFMATPGSNAPESRTNTKPPKIPAKLARPILP